MSTRHVIYTQEPGVDGTGITSIEKEQLTLDVAATTTAVARLDPGEVAAYTGAIVRESPTGPKWSRDVVYADWYSDINNAITAAKAGGNGGITRIPKNTGINQTGHDPARLTDGVILEGEDPKTSILEYRDAASAIAVATLATGADRPTVRNIRVWGNNTATVGIDFRGVQRGIIENVEVSGFTDAQIWFGGDFPTYAAGWNNVLRTARITAPANGAGIRFSGTVVSGGVNMGAPTANRISLYDVRMIGLSLTGSIGIDLVEGDTNMFWGGDIGYGNVGTVFKLGALAIGNKFIGGASEDVTNAVDCSGERNVFIGWQFPSSSTLTMRTAAKDNSFVECPYLGSIVEENASYNNTRVVGPTASHFDIPRVTSLPAAGIARRGQIVYVANGVGVNDDAYICMKNTADGYSWRKLSWT